MTEISQRLGYSFEMQFKNGGLWRKCIKISKTLIASNLKTAGAIDLKFEFFIVSNTLKHVKLVEILRVRLNFEILPISGKD